LLRHVTDDMRRFFVPLIMLAHCNAMDHAAWPLQLPYSVVVRGALSPFKVHH
jgi:hypothetical protein